MAECLSLGVRAPGELAFFELEPPEVIDGGIAVRTLFSGLEPDNVERHHDRAMPCA